MVPSLPPISGPRSIFGPAIKDRLRKAALARRKAFVQAMSDGARAQLEQQLARHLTAILAGARVVGGYAPMGSEISPLLAMEEARAVGAIVAFPAFDHPAKPFRFRAGDPAEPGPFGIMQPGRKAALVDPDLILVPLVAIDPQGTRLGRGKGHYDAALARLRKGGARLVGIGWPNQLIEEEIPADEWDIALDGFVSPDEVRWFRTESR
ncbi:MAG: 5-formyltetrahydrofolate cyclo-ligase [Sphingomicrobium sp.]